MILFDNELIYKYITYILIIYLFIFLDDLGKCYYYYFNLVLLI